jgi:hypothetical protein
MNGIIGMTVLTLESELTRQQRENLMIVSSLASSLLTIIDDILDISKIEAGRMTMEQIPFSLRLAVFSVLKTLCVKASQNKLDLIFDIDPTIPDQLIGDPLRLRQVITNLIGNAVKFTTKGQVALSCRVKRYDDLNGVEIEFCVADTGIGIQQDKLDVIFDTFAQADGSTTRKYGGTGLGLTISKRLVNLMSGNLWVESTYGEGSRFFFNIVAELTTTAEQSVVERLSPWLNRYVLFIDTLGDETGIVGMLKKLGLQPIVVHSVKDATDLQEKGAKEKGGKPVRFDTMIVDSLKAAEKLRTVEHLRYIPIVLLAPVSPVISTSWESADEERAIVHPDLKTLPSSTCHPCSDVASICLQRKNKCCRHYPSKTAWRWASTRTTRHPCRCKNCPTPLSQHWKATKRNRATRAKTPCSVSCSPRTTMSTKSSPSSCSRWPGTRSRWLIMARLRLKSTRGDSWPARRLMLFW